MICSPSMRKGSVSWNIVADIPGKAERKGLARCQSRLKQDRRVSTNHVMEQSYTANYFAAN